MEKQNKFYIGICSTIILIYFLIHTLLMLDFFPMCKEVAIFNYITVLILSFPSTLFIRNYIKKSKESTKLNYYAKKLNETIIHQSHNELFYDGNVTEGSKHLTKEATLSTFVDRCSIWLYNNDKTAINCEQLYIKSEDKWYSDIVLNKKDYEPYFNSLIVDPIIIADDAFSHQSTRCFSESYLIPLGIKSMLDVPILYKGKTIGVICLESYKQRNWHKVEVNFAEMLSSIFSFMYSVKENKKVELNLKDFEDFVNETALVSKTDKNGKIIYANKKFMEICGYSKREIIGKDHNIVNSGLQPKNYWPKMYKKTVKDKKIWHDIVVNKRKNGKLYYVDTYIKAEFDHDTDELLGFSSIRQDVTELIETLNEINKKNTYLEHAAKILRHDMHSGINTYIPRGISSLERRLTQDIIDQNKLESPLKMLKEGLKHTQKVYKGVYEFTNLVKKDASLSKDYYNLKEILINFLKSTAYLSQVKIEELPNYEVNESLFCTAIDNLIRNGLKYNDSNNKIVTIYMEDEDTLIVQDNGRGLTQEEFDAFSKPYSRDKSQKEAGTGLGLNICIAILNEHGFNILCEKNEIGTKIKIKLK
jgi:PAS domain S-box-containing protein